MLLSDFIKTRARKVDEKIAFYEDKENSYHFASDLGCPVATNYFFGDSADDIPFEELPSDYVVKWNNLQNAKGILLVKNGKNYLSGESISHQEIKQAMTSVRTVHDESSKRSASLRLIKPRIIVEELLNPVRSSLKVCDELKLYCIGGLVSGILFISGRFSDKIYKRHYTTNWDPLFMRKVDIELQSTPIDTRPHQLDEILQWAEKLSNKIGNPLVRVDFYLTRKGPVFGEFTFNPAGGRGFLEEQDREFGMMLKKHLDDA